jgi:hypothetical protein
MQGLNGHLVVKLPCQVNITSFTIDHTARDKLPDICAPRDMEVWGVGGKDEAGWETRKPDIFPPSIQAHVLGKFTYDARSPHIAQTFPVLGLVRNSLVGHQTLALVILNNWGDGRLNWLCRFWVHGSSIS